MSQGAPLGNDNAAYTIDEIKALCKDLFKWMGAPDYNSEWSFPDCDYRTIRKYIELHPIDLQPQKKEFDKAQRLTLKHWEDILKGVANGQIEKGNATAVIFALKNKFREHYRDRQEIEHSGDNESPIHFVLDERFNAG